MLPLRLAQIKKMLLPYRGVADIGTDHALLPLELAQHPFWEEQKIIGIDPASDPLEQGWKNLRQKGLEKRVELRQGWGFDPLRPREVEQAVIAGLGGRKIVSIVDRGREKNPEIKHLFLQPQRDLLFLRRWLVQNGWAIVTESIQWEKGHYYFFIRADWGCEERNYQDWELEIGPQLLEKKSPLLVDYLEEKVQEFNGILQKIGDKRPGHPREKYWEEKIRLFKGVQKWLLR